MKIFLISLLLLTNLNLLSQTNQREFNFDFDYAQFAYDSTSNYIEFYYSFGQESLLQNQTDSSAILEGILDIKITDTLTNTSVVNKQWKVAHEVIDSNEVSKSLVGIISFILPEGDYQCIISGRDLNDSTMGRVYKEIFKVNPFADSVFSASNIQLASNIIQNSPNESSVFYKNSFEIVPLPVSIYGQNLPVVFYYLELYNLQSAASESSMKLSTLVYNSRNKLFFSKSKNLNQSVNSRVEVGTIAVNKFPTDTYTLVIVLTDTAKNYGVSSSKRFYILNPDVEVNDSLNNNEISNVFATQFGAMSEEELDDLFGKSKYIATSQEIKQFGSLNSKESKQEFLYKFWNARDEDPSTAKNEFMLEYLKRIKGTTIFNALGKEGWKTDRGRVMLKYGEPSEIERFPNQIDTKPYEIWHYNEIEGGVIFVFADLTNFSDYQLIHSTARGELRDDNWYRRIQSI